MNNFIDRDVTPVSAARYNGLVDTGLNASLYLILMAVTAAMAIGGTTLFQRRKRR